VDGRDQVAQRFEEHRPRLRAVAYRMLGSLSEADDVVQEAWLRLSRSDETAIENLGGWLTTVLARLCLNALQARKSRRELPLDVHVPDPVVDREDGSDPERQLLIADSVGLALLVVLDTLSPPERIAFVLHDIFGVPFDQIAPILERSTETTRQLASRARRRIQRRRTDPDPDLPRQRQVVDAFLAAARDGDFEALLELLDPDVVLRADSGARRAPESIQVEGALAVAQQTPRFAQLARSSRPVLVNGTAGFVVAPSGRIFAVAGLTVRNGKIVEIDILADPQRLQHIDLNTITD